MKKIYNSLKRFPKLILRPAKYFSDEIGLLLDGLLVTVFLAAVTALSKLSWGRLIGQPVSAGDAFSSSALNSVMAWTGFFAVYYLFMVIFRKQSNLVDLFGVSGSAGLPLLLITLFSALLWWLGAILSIPLSISTWTFIQYLLNWLGVALSWPGWMAYLIFRYKLGLKKMWTILLPLLFLAGLFVSWLITL